MPMNAFMPGEHNYQLGKPMPGQGGMGAPSPAKKRNPIMNAFSTVLEFGAPEAFEQGRQKRITRDVGNALAGGDYEGAANTYLKGGNIEQGLELRGMGQEQETAQRQQEAQSVLSLFSQMPAMQINEYAMSDPANFERMTGMTAEEYLQAAQRSGDPEKFREFIITKAQAELGQMPSGPTEGKAINNRLVNPVTGEVMGDYSDPEKPEAPSYKQVTTADGIYEYIEGQPDSMTFLGKAPASGSGSGADSYGLNVIWGQDENGNPVAMQPSKGGGLRTAQTPDGVSLLDPYQTAYDRKLGASAAGSEAERVAAETGVLATEDDMLRLGRQIDLAITQTNKGNTGLINQFRPNTDLAATLKTIRASGAFTSLVNLKAQGGTLGALSDTELQLLEAKIANVERSQNEEQLDANLLELKLALEGSAKRIRAAYEKEYSAGRYGRGVGAGSGSGSGSGSGKDRPVGPSGQPVPEGFE